MGLLVGGGRCVSRIYGKCCSRCSQERDWHCPTECLCVCLGSAMRMECTAANWKFVSDACSLPYSRAVDTA